MPDVLTNILLRFGAAATDQELAAGRPPDTSPHRAARARQLVDPRYRHTLAANWEHLLEVTRRPPGGLSGRAPSRRDRVSRAEPEIRALIRALHVSGPVPARGVALAARLLADGSGPVYNPHAPEDLSAATARAIKHLDPSLPLAHELDEFGRGRRSL